MRSKAAFRGRVSGSSRSKAVGFLFLVVRLLIVKGDKVEKSMGFGESAFTRPIIHLLLQIGQHHEHYRHSVWPRQVTS